MNRCLAGLLTLTSLTTLTLADDGRASSTARAAWAWSTAKADTSAKTFWAKANPCGIANCPCGCADGKACICTKCPMCRGEKELFSENQNKNVPCPECKGTGKVAIPDIFKGKPTSQPATLVLYVPNTAKVWLQGQLMEGSGAERIFATPPLIEGKEYTYTVRVMDAYGSEETRKVLIKAGQHAIRENFRADGARMMQFQPFMGGDCSGGS